MLRGCEAAFGKSTLSQPCDQEMSAEHLDRADDRNFSGEPITVDHLKKDTICILGESIQHWGNLTPVNLQPELQHSGDSCDSVHTAREPTTPGAVKLHTINHRLERHSTPEPEPRPPILSVVVGLNTCALSLSCPDYVFTASLHLTFVALSQCWSLVDAQQLT